MIKMPEPYLPFDPDDDFMWYLIVIKTIKDEKKEE